MEVFSFLHFESDGKKLFDYRDGEKLFDSLEISGRMFYTFEVISIDLTLLSTML